MMFAVPTEKYEMDEDIEKALEMLLIIHADHEQNCSTSTVRLVGSSHANLFASISAGISALWGPLHGGANQAVMEMLQGIHNNGGDVSTAIKAAKDKQNSFRLMGFGHRVYKNYDPRATIIKGHCDKILSKLKKKDPLLEIAKRLEEAGFRRSILCREKALPKCRLLFWCYLSSYGHSCEHVYCYVCAW